jgi:hypothetical protein
VQRVCAARVCGCFDLRSDPRVFHRDTKSADGETTLLHYLVKLVNSKYPEAVNWGRELKNVPIAARSTD